MAASGIMSGPIGISRFLLLALMALCLPLSGCASKYGKQTTKVNHYPDCYSPINELRQNEFVVMKSAATGAVAGAALGALIGYAATGKASGAAAGAAVGGVTGAAAGGIYGQHQKDKSDEARLADYNSSLEGNIREVDKATAAAKVARQCYDRQFTAAASEFKAGHISREQFNSRYIEVTQGLEEAANILGEANQNSAKVAADYNRAVDQEAQRVTGKGASQSSGEARQVSSLRTKSGDMQRSVSASQEEERLLRQRLASTHQQAKDLMS